MPSLAEYPALVVQIDRRKNGATAPESIPHGSRRKLWWRCPAGPDHLWEAPVSTRTAGHGCPFCANLAISVTNTLAAVAPEIAREWHPRKNGKLTPHDVVAGTDRAVWWKCPAAPDHEWRRAIVARVYTGRRCPFCAGQRPSAAYNLAANAPEIAAQWHAKKNGKLTPRDVTVGSGKSVWWKCPKGPDHEWRCAVGERVKHGCPFCSNKRVSCTNSLAVAAPAIADEWHPTKNGALTPHDVLPGSARRAWWRCPKARDHEWSVTIANRTSGSGCPFCVNRKLCASNSLAVVSPRIAAEWHPTRNGKLTPRDVVAGTTRQIWWRCASGHVWRAGIGTRAQKGSNCPECWRLRRRQPVVTTGKRRRPVRLAGYEGSVASRGTSRTRT